MVRKLLTFTELLLILLAVCCAGYLGFYAYQSRSGKAEFEEIREQVGEQASKNANEDRNADGILKEYEDLYNRNTDFCGWLKVMGTAVDYPVVKAGDNDFYMHRDFYKNYKYCGIPFMDYRCSINPDSTNIIIYAHNMKDGSMFKTLLNYDDKSFFDTNGTIEFNTLYDKNKYKLISVFYTTPEAFDYISFVDCNAKDEFDNYIEKIKALSLYDTGEDAMYGERLLTLSTCSYNKNNERFVVIAKREN